MPVALEDVLVEEADAAVAEAHGRGGEAVDVFAVQEVALQLLFRDAVGGCVVELSQQADFTDIGFLSPFAFATEVEGRKHLLTQRAHEMFSFLCDELSGCEGRHHRREGWWKGESLLTAASAAYLNNALQLTPYSVRPFLAPAFGSG